MYLLLICISLPVLVMSENFDPDKDICEKSILDGSVNSGDDKTYIFKDKYYWSAKPFHNDSGIIGFANLTSDKWPAVDSKIIGTFAIPVSSGATERRTIFVIKGEWFVYERGILSMSGKTSVWPGFDDMKQISATFAADYQSSEVFVLHSDNNNYTLYDMSSPIKPNVIMSGPTSIRDRFVFFIDDHRSSFMSKKSGTSGNLKSLMDVRVGLTYKNSIVFISENEYCIINMTLNKYEKKCEPQDGTRRLFNCPLPLHERPTTTTPPAPTTTGSTTLTSVTTTILSTDGNTINNITTSNATENEGEGEKPNVSAIDTEKSITWAIVFIGLLIFLSVAAMVIITIASRLHDNRPKGSVSYI